MDIAHYPIPEFAIPGFFDSFSNKKKNPIWPYAQGTISEYGKYRAAVVRKGLDMADVAAQIKRSANVPADWRVMVASLFEDRWSGIAVSNSSIVVLDSFHRPSVVRKELEKSLKTSGIGLKIHTICPLLEHDHVDEYINSSAALAVWLVGLLVNETLPDDIEEDNYHGSEARAVLNLDYAHEPRRWVTGVKLAVKASI